MKLSEKLTRIRDVLRGFEDERADTEYANDNYYKAMNDLNFMIVNFHCMEEDMGANELL